MKPEEVLERLENAMLNLNRHISFNFIAMSNKQTVQRKDHILREINRFIGEWIKQIREIKENLENE